MILLYSEYLLDLVQYIKKEASELQIRGSICGERPNQTELYYCTVSMTYSTSKELKIRGSLGLCHKIGRCQKFFASIASLILLVTRVQSWSLGGAGHRSYSHNDNPCLSRRGCHPDARRCPSGESLWASTSVLPAFAATDDDAAAGVVTSPLVEASGTQ
jgi:hypothetical protein